MQIAGPYDHWRHLHKFEELNGGTLMTDQVRFRVPLGLVGRTVAGSFVRSDVESIFAYRTQIIGELFGNP
jgi:ligand-binding SRPBCC domain-containing protein